MDTIVCMGRKFDVHQGGMVESKALPTPNVLAYATLVTFADKGLIPLLKLSVEVTLAREHHAF